MLYFLFYCEPDLYQVAQAGLELETLWPQLPKVPELQAYTTKCSQAEFPPLFTVLDLVHNESPLFLLALQHQKLALPFHNPCQSKALC